MQASPLLSLLRRLEAQSLWRLSYTVLPQQQQQQQQFSSSSEPDASDKDLELGEWYENESVTAHDALRMLVARIQAHGPVKQHHLQRLYQRCSTGEELDRALKLTRLNYLARGELRQHAPFSHRTSEVFISRALSVGAPEMAARALRDGSAFGLSADSHKECHPLLIYYSKQGDLVRMFELFDFMKSAGRSPGPDTCYILVKGCVDCGRPDLADLTIQEFKAAGIRTRAGTELYLEQNRHKPRPNLPRPGATDPVPPHIAAAQAAVAAAQAAAAAGAGAQ